MASEQFKELCKVSTVRDKHVQGHEHKDKLAQTKLRDKELKEAAKAERDKHKHDKEEERLAAAAVYRMDRAHNHANSKRAAKEAREAEKLSHKDEGDMCEHGVWKCKICHPHVTHKFKPRDAVRDKEVNVIPVDA